MVFLTNFHHCLYKNVMHHRMNCIETTDVTTLSILNITMVSAKDATFVKFAKGLNNDF